VLAGTRGRLPGTRVGSLDPASSTKVPVFLLFLLFLQQIISGRLHFGAGILDRGRRSSEKNSEKTARAFRLLVGIPE
jgi:hypothetical protein